MLKHRLAAAAAGTLALALLAGCSAGGPAGGAGKGTDGTGKGTVKMVAWPGPEGDAMAKIVDAYNSGQGKTDGVNVEMVLLSRQDTFSKETALMSSKSADVDIYWTASYNVGQFSPSLDPLEGIDTSGYFPVAVDGLSYKDKLYALPLDVSNHFLLYRTDLIGALLADPAQRESYRAVAAQVLGEARDPKDPAEGWDLDDFTAMSAFFSKSSNPNSPTEYGTALQAKNLLYNTMIWNDLLWGAGGSWEKNGKANLDSEAGRKALKLYSDIYTNKWTSPDSAQAEFPETQAALQSGSAAFAIQWSAAYAELNDPAKSPAIAGKVGIAPVPGGKTHVHALSVSLNAYSKNKAAAKKWLSYLATPEAMTQYAREGGIPAMPQVLAANADLNPVFSYVGDAIANNGYAAPVFPKTFQAYSKIAEDLSGAWVGQGDPAAALRTANENLQALLDG